MDQHFVNGMHFYIRVEVIEHRWHTGDQHVPPVSYHIGDPVLQYITHGGVDRFRILEAMFLIQLIQSEMAEESNWDAGRVPTRPFQQSAGEKASFGV
jgi:hypothetical protein